MTFELENLRAELRDLRATPLQHEMLEGQPARARAAIAQAVRQKAANPIAYALSLFKSETFEPDAHAVARAQNQRATPDPRYTDDGERVWQAHEIDDVWRRGYLENCIRAFLDDEEPAAHYQPSEDEMGLWSRAFKQRTTKMGFDHLTCANALASWAEVWGYEDLMALANPKEPEPVAAAIDPYDIPF